MRYPFAFFRQAAFVLTTAATLTIPHLSNAGDQKMTDESAVLTAIKTMTASLEQGDLNAVMESYEPGAAILFEPGRPVTDAAAARQIFAELAALKPAVSYRSHEVYVTGDIAVHFAPWSMQGTAPDGAAVEMGGLSVAILRRQTDGSWRMVLDNPYGAQALEAKAAE